jgi:CheY-like chemotaxis protein
VNPIRSALVVDDASVFRETIAMTMRPHFAEIFTAENRSEGVELLHEKKIDLLISDLVLPDGDGFDVIGAGGRLERPPLSILVTARPSDGARRMASRLGALACLTKPVSFRDIARTLAKHTSARAISEDRVRFAPLGRARVRDTRNGEALLLTWEIADISRSGAFLHTEGPLPIGTRRGLVLEVGDVELAVTAEVVRVQPPAWGRIPGIGVRFLDLDPRDAWRLEAALSASVQRGSGISWPEPRTA